MDVSNDREVERLGANATAVYAWNFWEQLSNATRQDGSRFLTVEECNLEEIHHSEQPTTKQQPRKEGQSLLSATRQVVLTDTVESDQRLYQRFRSNFGVLDVRQLSHSDLSGPRWQSLLLASEGIIDSYNFMPLLRLDAHDIFWMTDTEASHGIAVVPRAQFIFVELARLREGIYDSSSFRYKLHQWDMTCWTEDLWLAWKHQDDSAAAKILNLLRNQWRYPNSSILKQTGILNAVRYGWKSSSSSSEVIRKKCYDLLQYWQDIWELTKLFRKSSAIQRKAIQHAAQALAFPDQKQGDTSQLIANTNSFTRTTSSLEDLIPSKIGSAPNIFSEFGIVILNEFLNPSQVDECKSVAYSCLQALIDEQLTPRGLIVDGANTYDFTEVRQRPGHRVDNRYKVMDSRTIQGLGKRLLEELPAILNTRHIDIHYKLLYGGVVHSFPRAAKSAPTPESQIWHRDGPSLFQSAHHETHCLNVFIPLVDISAENGATEFIPGSHDDAIFQKYVSELWNQPDNHKLAVRADVKAGSLIIFDVRVLHRGLSNASMEDRPILYFTIARTWFEEEHMFDDSKSIMHSNYSIGPSPRKGLFSMSIGRLYEMVSGRKPPMTTSSYGHPHYTNRFDLMVDEIEDDTKKIRNIEAVLNFCASENKDQFSKELIDILQSPISQKLKVRVLDEARRNRAQQREEKARAYIHYKSLTDIDEDNEDFASFSTDMSDVSTLYALTSKLVIGESQLITKLGFTQDQDGLCILLALLKAHSLRDFTTIKTASMEEAFTAWWHAGVGRFHLKRCSSESAPRLLVVFSSLGSGIARPEWGGSLSKLAPSKDLDLMHVLDPAFSWYCQDPSCSWKGCEYYFQELQRKIQGYNATLFLGDSMGAAAALRFSVLANMVLAFTPQVDIVSYTSITRHDFNVDVRKEFQNQLIDACQTTNAQIVIHYGENCQEDSNAVHLLPCRQNITLVAHDYDDHTLSLHLRDLEKLQGIIDSAVATFLREQY